jgi:hypothetical protein
VGYPGLGRVEWAIHIDIIDTEGETFSLVSQKGNGDGDEKEEGGGGLPMLVQLKNRKA